MDSQHDWIVRAFRVWATELDELVRLARTGEAPAGQEPPRGEAGRIALMLRRLNDRLAALMREGERHDPAFGADELEHIRFALVALADEMVLAADWPGRRAWLHEPLEARLFGTQKAGQEIIHRIEAVLKGESGEQPRLALAYMLLLSLGFRGALRGPQGAARAAHLRERLYQAMTRRTPDADRLATAPVTAAAYRNVLTETQARQLPYLRPWLTAAAAAVIGYLVVTWILWRQATGPVVELIVTLRRMVGGA